MSKPRKRRDRPYCEILEVRRLLSTVSPVGVWVGQGTMDLVGRSATPGPNGVRDVQIQLTNLPEDLGVTSAEVRGYGGGIWTYGGTGTHWAAAFERLDGASTANVFIEPARVEVGRPFSVRLWFEDGSTTLVSFSGGVADPTFRMPEAVAQPTWVGQDGSDRVGPGPSVGPDGVQDTVIALANLTTGVEITEVDVREPGGLAWKSGANPEGLANAELIRDPSDPSLGRVYIQPDRDLAGGSLTLTITYANFTIDIVEVSAGSIIPSLPVEDRPAPLLRDEAVSARWLGQFDDPIAGKGAVRVALEGLPTDRALVGASLSSGSRAVTWAYKATPESPIPLEPLSRPLAFQRNPSDPSQAAISFPPEGDELGTEMVLRLQYDDGTSSIVRFPGGEADSSLRADPPESSLVVARPGDDLQTLVEAYGAVHLSAGEYRLDQPLVLNRPVSLTAEPGATLLFRQPESADPWPAAITIHHGNTTLDGFAVRFEGPVRWDWTVPYEPAVIASTDARDKLTGSPRVGLVLSHLDLEGPPATSLGGPLERSAMLVNFVSAEDGKILNNRLRGGSVRVFGGPWEIAGNTYLGALPGTWAYDVFAMSYVHGVAVTDNVTAPLPGSGKTYRFLVMTQDGSDIRVERNKIEGIGARDDDPQPHPNSPEVILTEAYHVQFEGLPKRLSNEGTILEIPPPQGDLIRSGDLVAVVSGPMAGQWRRVAHVIDQQTLVLDRPLPTGQELGAVSVFRGFVDLVIAENEVDVRGGTEVSPLVLGGAHADVEVFGNHFLGGGPIRLESAASESTVHWGWTHTPQFEVRFVENTIEDSQGGLDAGMVRYPKGKSSQGRTYFDGEIRDNLFAWSPAFFEMTGADTPPPAMLLGDPRSIDPLEVRVEVAGNLLKLPPEVSGEPGITVVHATYNGSSVLAGSFPLTAQPVGVPRGLRLVSDTGRSASDRLTSDARLTLDPPSWAVGFEYRLAGQDHHRPISSLAGFLPEGLVEGVNTVYVRAIDDYGRAGPETTLTFTLDSKAPGAVSPRLGPGQDTGFSDTDRLTRLRTPIFEVDGEATDTLVLVSMPSGREIDRRIGPGELRVGEPLADGQHSFAVRRIDAAGNARLGAPTTITVDGTPPQAVAVKLSPGQDSGASSTDGLIRQTNPTLQAILDNSDVLTLLRDGEEVDQTTGTGQLRAGGPLADGTYHFRLRRIDRAGNATDGPLLSVTIDSTPPTPVTGLVHLGSGVFRFDPMPDAADYTYQVGDGPVVPLAGATSFRVRGLPFDPTLVVVRAIDRAGNVGEGAELLASMALPVGSWLGQREGVDLVGPSASKTEPDGTRDVALALTGLPGDRQIVSAEVRGWGGGIWQYNVAGGVHWKAALIRAPGSDRAELYIQPYQHETGRSYFVRLHFSDGSTVGVTIQGGQVDPTLPTDFERPGVLGGPVVDPSSIGILDPIPGTGVIPGASETPGREAAQVEGHSNEAPVASVAIGMPAPMIGAGWRGRLTWRERLALIRAARRDQMLAKRLAWEAALQARMSRIPRRLVLPQSFLGSSHRR